MGEHISTEDLLQEATRIGVRVAMETIQKEKDKAAQEKKKRRLQNTRLLLKHYRTMKAGCMNSVFNAAQTLKHIDDLDIQALMARLDDEHFRVESTFRTAGRTYILIQHIDKTIELYGDLCVKSQREENERRCRIVKAMYIDGDTAANVDDIAASEHIEPRTVYKDITAAVDTLSVLLYGLDGLQF